MLLVANTWPVLRGFMTGLAKGLPADLVDVTPSGYRNNLRWQLGHVVTCGEILSVVPMGGERSHPAAWDAFFGLGTDPGSFTEETPSWLELVAALEASTAHITATLEGAAPDAPLVAPPFPQGSPLYTDSLGVLIGFMTWHEGAHLGVIRAMKSALDGG